MADYNKMYYVLCKAIDEVIDPLERIPYAQPYSQKLQNALWEAEEIYLSSTPYTKEPDDATSARSKTDD